MAKPMAMGTVRWFSEQKGYGFISPDHGGGDVFVHYSDIESAWFRSLEEDEKVTYEVTPAQERHAGAKRLQGIGSRGDGVSRPPTLHRRRRGGWKRTGRRYQGGSQHSQTSASS